MKVLILAEQCNPEWASLPSFSFQLARAISNNTNITLVTHIRNREEIERLVDIPKFEIVYIDNEFLARPLHHFSQFLSKIKIGGLMTNMAFKYPAYILFEYLAYKKFKNRLKSGEFDLVQRISPVSPALPSPISKWTNVPFIFGPINGALPWPEGYQDAVKKEREIIYFIRNIYKFFPYYRTTFKYAVKILAAFEHVKADIPKEYHHKIIQYDELGVDSKRYYPLAKNENSKETKCIFLFVGRLVPYKSADVVIKAFAESKILPKKHELIIVGDGPEYGYLEKLITNYGLSESVKLVGWKTQEEVAQIMQQASIFVFPTIREVGGNVIIEALSSGLPCIVPDYGGPSQLIDSTCGFKIPLMQKAAFISNYRGCMENLAEDYELRDKLSKAARKKVLAKYDWAIKGKLMTAIFDRIVNQEKYD